MALKKAALVGLGTGLATGIAHGLAHQHFGEEQSFDEAGVTEVGAVVAGVSGLAGFAAAGGVGAIRG